MTASKMLLQRKYTRVISAYAKLKDISLREAMEIFYNSEVYQEIRNGISDMHCRSDEYLADEIQLETEH